MLSTLVCWSCRSEIISSMSELEDVGRREKPPLFAVVSPKVNTEFGAKNTNALSGGTSVVFLSKDNQA